MREASRYRYGNACGPRARSQYHFAPFEGEQLLSVYRANRDALRSACDGTAYRTLGTDEENTMRASQRELNAARASFETAGFAEPASAAQEAMMLRSAAWLWRALGERAREEHDVRDLNCMLKIGDLLSTRQARLVATNVGPVVRAAIELELCEVAYWQQQARVRRFEHQASSFSLRRADHHATELPAGRAMKFGMLLANTSRSRAYLDLLMRNDMSPSAVVLVSRGDEDDRASGDSVVEFDNTTPVRDRLRERGVPTAHVVTDDINARVVAVEVARLGVDLVVYSGYPGVRLKSGLLRSGAELLHVHGGRLPMQRGSTTVYYSLLKEGCCWASAIVMNEQLDRGCVVAQRRYPPPRRRSLLDHGYDPFIRADLLCRVMKQWVLHGWLPRTTQSVAGEMHYVMHPVLRHVVILAGESDDACSQRHDWTKSSRTIGVGAAAATMTGNLP